jgi:hypothetical protein
MILSNMKRIQDTNFESKYLEYGKIAVEKEGLVHEEIRQLKPAFNLVYDSTQSTDDRNTLAKRIEVFLQQCWKNLMCTDREEKSTSLLKCALREVEEMTIEYRNQMLKETAKENVNWNGINRWKAILLLLQFHLEKDVSLLEESLKYLEGTNDKISDTIKAIIYHLLITEYNRKELLQDCLNSIKNSEMALQHLAAICNNLWKKSGEIEACKLGLKYYKVVRLVEPVPELLYYFADQYLVYLWEKWLKEGMKHEIVEEMEHLCRDIELLVSPMTKKLKVLQSRILRSVNLEKYIRGDKKTPTEMLLEHKNILQGVTVEDLDIIIEEARMDLLSSEVYSNYKDQIGSLMESWTKAKSIIVSLPEIVPYLFIIQLASLLFSIYKRSTELQYPQQKEVSRKALKYSVMFFHDCLTYSVCFKDSKILRLCQIDIQADYTDAVFLYVESISAGSIKYLNVLIKFVEIIEKAISIPYSFITDQDAAYASLEVACTAISKYHSKANYWSIKAQEYQKKRKPMSF